MPRNPAGDGVPPRFLLPRSVVFWLVACLAAADFARLHVLHNVQNDYATLDHLIALDAETPYRYRVLIPQLIRLVEGAGRCLGLPVERLMAAAFVEAAFVLALVVVVVNLVHLYVPSRPFAAVAGLGVLAPLLHVYALRDQLTLYYPWDLPQTFFFGLGAYLVLTRRLGLFHAVFVLATLVRETSPFLTLMLAAVYAGRMPARRLALHVAAQALIWLALRLVIVLALGGWQGAVLPGLDTEGGTVITKGDLFWYTLPVNLTHFGRYPGDLIPALGLYGYLLVPLVFLGFRLPFASLRRLLLVLLPYFALLLSVGIVVEFRVYGEMTPVVWLAASVLAARAFGLRTRAGDVAPSARRCQTSSRG